MNNHNFWNDKEQADDIIKEASKLGIEISENSNSMLEKYSEMLIKYNEFMNLTGITEYREVVLKHLN